MKTLKFVKEKIALILSSKKTVTWRVFDDKNLQEGDKLIFLEAETEKPFAKAEITEVIEKKFKDLTEQEKKEHGYQNNEEIYKTYSEYYKTQITPETSLKIIKFKLLENT